MDKVNRSLSVRSRKSEASGEKPPPKHRFNMASLRSIQQPDLSKKLFKLVKTENHAITAVETAGRERASIASQLSEWGEGTDDDAISEISDKIGVLMAEIAEQEDSYAQSLEEYRGILKQIRDIESSVQPSRDHKSKVSDEIQKLKYKEPQSTKIAQLEQELVRAEAQNLVAEAQRTNITRQKFKEAYDVYSASTIERAEKQILLAKHARSLVNLLDDSPVIPGDSHPAFDQTDSVRSVLNDAEDALRAWTPDLEPIRSSAAPMGTGALPEGEDVAEQQQQLLQQSLQQSPVQTSATATPTDKKRSDSVSPRREKSGAEAALEKSQNHAAANEAATTAAASHVEPPTPAAA